MDTDALLRAEVSELWGDAEVARIWGEPVGDSTSPMPGRYGSRMLELGQSALCLSGGGIRSAAFALGVVQALARKGLLPHFQYLSTVSGGGYFGAFLSRWIAEETSRLIEERRGNSPDHDLPEEEASAAMRPALANVQRALARGQDAIGVEPAPIRWLRENSNFITPRVGLTSADTWTAVATSVRNIAINWLVFAPALVIAVAVPFLGAALLSASGDWFADLCIVAGMVLLTIAAAAGARVLPSHMDTTERWAGGRIVQFIVLPAAVGAAALSGGLAPQLPGLKIWGGGYPGVGHITPEWLSAFSADPEVRLRTFAFLLVFGPLVVGYLAAWIHAARARRPELAESNSVVFRRNVPIWLVAATVSAMFYVWGVSLATEVSCQFTAAEPGAPEPASCAWRRDVIATFAVVWGIMAQLALTIPFVALRVVPRRSGLLPDLDREWLARLSAEKIRVAFAWTLFAAGALLFRHLLVRALSYLVASPEEVLTWVIGAAGSVSGLAAVLGGRAATTAYRPNAGSTRKRRVFDYGIAFATFAFILILLFLLGQLEFKFMDWLAQRLPPTAWSQVFAHVGTIAAAGLLLGFTSTHINVNRFSLNGMYRNRLARAFLGAARRNRADVDPFTGFAPSDNIRLHALKAVSEATGRRVLMPVINVALNVLGGPRLAWQERKAQSFIFTPLACGSAALAEEPGTQQHAGRYIPADLYAGSEADLGLAGQGVSLATAIAISGAAASPSMGYHSSPATAFLMTLFNVRLGAWLPNPGRDDLPARVLRSSGPRNALMPLLRELLGMTDAEGQAVYLSDGGHFENLGLYEMVRRRCRYIIVSDAGCDPNAGFADLGNAIRKIRIDLGIDIHIDTVEVVTTGAVKESSTFFALGQIRYHEGTGDLLYIKPACVQGLPADVRAYSLARSDFPHESTADQWFSESQFESYRRLGAHLTDKLGDRGSYAETGLAGLFQDLQERVGECRPVPAARDRSSTRPDLF
jgi:hypothetical protein